MGRVQTPRSAATGASAPTTRNSLGHGTLRPRQVAPASAGPGDPVPALPTTLWLLSPKALSQATGVDALGCPCSPSRDRRMALPVAAAQGPAGTRTPMCSRTSQLVVTSACRPSTRTAQRTAPSEHPHPRPPVRTAAAARPRQPAFQPRLFWALRASGTVRDLPRPAAFTRLARAVARRAASPPGDGAAQWVRVCYLTGVRARPTCSRRGQRCRERVHSFPGRARLCTPGAGVRGPTPPPARTPLPGRPVHGGAPPQSRTDRSEPPGHRLQRLRSCERDPRDSRHSAFTRLYSSNENHETRNVREKTRSSRSQLSDGHTRAGAEGCVAPRGGGQAGPGRLAHALAGGHGGGDAGPLGCRQHLGDAGKRTQPSP